MRSAEFQRGYDAGYKQALLDAIRERDATEARRIRRFRENPLRLGGPDSRFKPRGVPGSIYND